MNSTWLTDALNTTQAYANNGSTTEEITHEEGWEDDDMFGDEKGFSHIQIEGTPYMVCILIIASLGVVGNVMSFLLMMDAKIGSFAYSIYLKWLALSDTVLLIIVTADDIMDIYKFLDYFLGYHLSICMLWTYFRSLTSTLSPWLVVALTLDRFVCVVFPLSRHMLCTRSKAIKLCVILIVLAAAMESYILIASEIRDDYCDIERYAMVVRYDIFLNIVIKSTAPCFLVLVLNIITVIRIRRSILFREQFKQKDASKTTQEKVVDKSTLPLLLVSVFAFVTLIPRTIAEVIKSTMDPDHEAVKMAMFLWPVFNIIYLLNFAMNFYILIASWPEYRSVIKRMFSRRESMTKSARRKESLLSSSTHLSKSSAPAVVVSVTVTSRQTDLASSVTSHQTDLASVVTSCPTNLASASAPEVNLDSASAPKLKLAITSAPEVELASASAPEVELVSASPPEVELASDSALEVKLA